ncbi:MAG: hypothetical protein PHU21_08075 [Elusimicrobia bacterium]|nr:hypothetical protein [Elusimicrobiota bacterium]
MDLQGLVSGMSGWNIVGNLLFSGLGFVALMFGRRQGRFQPMALGAALMLFPYFVSSTALMFAVGTALSAAAFFLRD